MTVEFVVDAALEGEEQSFVLARTTERGRFALTYASTLGGCAIEPWLDDVSPPEPEERRRLLPYAFTLKTKEDVERFRPGATVQLEGIRRVGVAPPVPSEPKG